MNYAYLFIDNLNGHSYENGLDQIKYSIKKLKKNISSTDKIVVFNNETSGKNIEYFKSEGIDHHYIELSRNYKGSDKINPISILVEKIICLMNFDEHQDIVLMDIDTTNVNELPNNFWGGEVVFDNIEYPIMQWRNLDKVLPRIPWDIFDIAFDNSFIMYNTGVIYIPKLHRKEICQKALKIVDYLNNNFDAEERCGNKLDEQIALSIVCQEYYGKYDLIKLSNNYIHHHWQDSQNNVKWWDYDEENEQKSKYKEFESIHLKNCLDLVLKYSDHLQDKVIIEVGSNIGLFSKCIVENISYKDIHLFEPSTEYLNESKILLKDYSNITYNNFAVGNSNEEMTLYKSKDSNIGWNTLYTKDPIQDERFYEKMNSEKISTVKLDDYFNDIERVDFIKIDVEGYERNVLEGSWNIIKKFKPYLLVEVSWGTNHPDWEDNKKTYEKLFSLGYERIDLDSIKNTENILFIPVRNQLEDNDTKPNINRYKLPISIGILSWNSSTTLRNTLESYRKNGLLNIANDITILFQEFSDEDLKIAREYNLQFIALHENIGIGNAFLKLSNNAKTNNLLLLEHDWELIENEEITYQRLCKGIDLLEYGCKCVRFRHRKNPGYPLYSRQAYEGKELEHYDKSLDLLSPHLIESIHWIEDPQLKFPDKIEKIEDFFITTSRWSNFTNNPCLYKKDFYINIVNQFNDSEEKNSKYYEIFENNLSNYNFVDPRKHSLEYDIGYWWSRQDFKIAQGEGLFSHNDIEKYQQPSTNLNKTQKSISFIFAHRDTDKWSTPLSIVNEFKRLGWKTEIYSLFDSNDNYTDENIYDILNTSPDIIFYMDFGQHISPILNELKKTGAFCIMESADDPQRFYANKEKALNFDLILSPDLRCVDNYKKMGLNVEWWTHFSDTNVYFPLENELKYIAVSSRGMGNDAYIIDSLATKYPNQIKNQNGFIADEHNEFLNSGFIVLQQSRYGEITRRIFEGMSCKKLVIADRLDSSTNIQNLFVDGEDIIFYDNEFDCLEKIFYYSNNKEIAQKISENGYKKVLEYHTQKQRVELILEKWKLNTQTK